MTVRTSDIETGERTMKINRFDPPGMNDDFGNDGALKTAYSNWLSKRFDVGVNSVTQFLADNAGGTCQFYNPVTHGSTDPDLPEVLGDIPWNGFPKQFLGAGPAGPNFAAAEPTLAPGMARVQDEYLEWHVRKNAAGKITQVDFTCEAYDYFDEFLAPQAPGKVVELYRKFVSPNVQEADLFPNGKYDKLNKWNTAQGAMHLTHPANNLFAEIFLAAGATVRRQKNGVELTSPIPLIDCAGFGQKERNSDPNIGFGVNNLARQRRMITLANPTGLYMQGFDGAGLTIDGAPAGGFFTTVRGTLPFGLRAIYKLPPALEAAGKTVSDVKIGATPITFGGQLAQRITMHLIGVASVAQSTANIPVGGCQPVEPVFPPQGLALTPAVGLAPLRVAKG
jgi:hypothetical protein